MYTRCPECRAVYQVNAEILAAAEGDVTCTRCGEVWCALLTLSDGHPGAAPPEMVFPGESPPLLRDPVAKDPSDEPAPAQTELAIGPWDPDTPAAVPAPQTHEADEQRPPAPGSAGEPGAEAGEDPLADAGSAEDPFPPAAGPAPLADEIDDLFSDPDDYGLEADIDEIFGALEDSEPDRAGAPARDAGPGAQAGSEEEAVPAAWSWPGGAGAGVGPGGAGGWPAPENAHDERDPDASFDVGQPDTAWLFEEPARREPPAPAEPTPPRRSELPDHLPVVDDEQFAELDEFWEDGRPEQDEEQDDADRDPGPDQLLQPRPRAIAAPPARRSAAWMLGSALLAVLLAGQWLWSSRQRLLEDPDARELLAGACAIVGCELPVRRDVSRIRLVSRDIRPHPSVDGALMISATLRNEADHPLAYPQVEIRLSDLQGSTVAARRFAPSEYLEGNRETERGMPPRTLLPLVFEVVDPGPRAVAFEFDFR